MVKVTMEQIINFRDNMGFFATANIPLKGAYKINKIKKTLEKEAEFYASEFQKLIDTYAKRDERGEFVFSEDGSQIEIQDDKIIECNEAIADLQELEVEVDNCNLSIEDLGDDLECTPNELEALMPFME